MFTLIGVVTRFLASRHIRPLLLLLIRFDVYLFRRLSDLCVTRSFPFSGCFLLRQIVEVSSPQQLISSSHLKSFVVWTFSMRSQYPTRVPLPSHTVAYLVPRFLSANLPNGDLSRRRFGMIEPFSSRCSRPPCRFLPLVLSETNCLPPHQGAPS